jgi:pimeloyl-ACP methyl ester carboxylesterase
MPFATINGHRVQYLENRDLGIQVDDARVPVVCIHGLGSSQNYYVPAIPYILGHRVVALTTYGAAESNSQGEELSLEGLAEDVVGLMDHLSITRAIIVGHSMGGPMALTVAAKHPDRVVAVVAIGPVNPSSVKPEVFLSRIETVLKGMCSQDSGSIGPRLTLRQRAWNHWQIPSRKQPQDLTARLCSKP